MLEGKNINLRIVEKDDLIIIKEWTNNLHIDGEYSPILQETIKDLEKLYDNLKEGKWYFIEKKDEIKIGFILHMLSGSGVPGIGYAIIPSERGKGYGTEAVKIVIDYIFLSKNIVRITAKTHPDNIASQKVLKKAGFKKEGILRKEMFFRGKWNDSALYSILREEWEGPKILLK